MAKKKENDTAGLLIILFLILVVLYCVATPVFLVGGWIFYSLKLLFVKKGMQGNESDFWLSSEENARFRSVSSELVAAIEEVEKAEKIGEQNNISRNKDGSLNQLAVDGPDSAAAGLTGNK